MIKIKDCKHGKFIFFENDNYIGKSMDVYGQYSEDEVALLTSLIKPGMVIIDGGANIGAFTVPMAKATGPNGLVIAFEPQTAIYHQLCGNIAINNCFNVITHQKALGSGNEEVLMPALDYTVENNFGGATVGTAYLNHAYKVGQLKLDDIEIHRCDLIKLDVQGMELEALKGGKDLISKHRPALYVENDNLIKSKELIEYIKGIDYQLYWHTPKIYSPDNFNKHIGDVFKDTASVNMLCFPKEDNIQMPIPEIEDVNDNPLRRVGSG